MIENGVSVLLGGVIVTVNQWLSPGTMMAFGPDARRLPTGWERMTEADRFAAALFAGAHLHVSPDVMESLRALDTVRDDGASAAGAVDAIAGSGSGGVIRGARE